MKYSIQYKILLSLSIVTFIGLSSLLLVAYKISDQNVSRIVHSTVIEAKKNLDLYLSQYFLINNDTPDATTLASEAGHISAELSSQMGADVEIFSMRGRSLSLSSASALASSDLSKALHGETVYSVNYKGGQVIVSLTYPILSDTVPIGVVRYSKDDSQLFSDNRRFQYILNLFAIFIFVIIFFTSFIISRQITRPLRALTQKTEKISSGTLDLDISITTNDEIGELARRFQEMLQRIREQIETINRDRDALREAQSQSKAFFDNVTHELKTPLTTILGYAQVLRDNGFHDEAFFDKGTAYIIDETKRLNRLVVQILELSKSERVASSYHFAKMNVSQLVEETCEEMRMKGKKYNIEIRGHVQGEILITGDRDKLKEVLINVIDNAIKYGRVNSTVDVDADADNQSVFIRIRDQGRGIPAELLHKVFEPFYRASKHDPRETGSAGLGLSISKSIIENHGGRLEITSEINHGTEVVIWLERDLS